MADKGFTIGKEISKYKLDLVIPPFATTGCQLSVSETTRCQNVAKHRVHIERLIAKIKRFQILSNRIPTTLFTSVNKIWTVCGLLTLFQDTFIKDNN